MATLSQQLLAYAMLTNEKDCLSLARKVAALISLCANHISPPSRNRYWAKAVEILDELCNLRGEGTESRIDIQDPANLIASFQEQSRTADATERVSGAFSRFYGIVSGIAID